MSHKLKTLVTEAITTQIRFSHLLDNFYNPISLQTTTEVGGLMLSPITERYNDFTQWTNCQ